MTAKEYIEAAHKLALTKEEISRFDLTDRFNNQFLIHERVYTDAKHMHQNEIIRFMKQYNSFPYNVYLFSFDEEPKKEGGRIFFGSTNYARLFINSENEEIQSVDIEEGDSIDYVAQDDKHFFDALYVFLELSAHRFRKEINVSDENKTKEYINLAIEKAGGKKYKFFYQSMGV